MTVPNIALKARLQSCKCSGFFVYMFSLLKGDYMLFFKSDSCLSLFVMQSHNFNLAIKLE